ncbi:hypothetical protein [Thermomonospora umbrina]|uniref:Secreted protein n=1 Tax=Thermomonospora umbrina TaxID=111806 RepID=A0A3D9T3Z5_9ACTN|nr:hypothetical protein [Thermomonospora umbrina]REE99975.1 hypothetical protein DFJ69_5495 [Thermomonospora umbrina]
MRTVRKIAVLVGAAGAIAAIPVGAATAHADITDELGGLLLNSRSATGQSNNCGNQVSIASTAKCFTINDGGSGKGGDQTGGLLLNSRSATGQSNVCGSQIAVLSPTTCVTVKDG